MSSPSDSDTLRAALEMLRPPPPRSPHNEFEPSNNRHHPPRRDRRRLVTGTIAALLLTVATGTTLVGLLNDHDGATSHTTASAPTMTSISAEAPSSDGVSDLLGPILGTNVDDGRPIAFPGQSVTAPTPAAGKAVGWQWQQCDRECRSIPAATSRIWTSPDTRRPIDVRVMILVDLNGRLVGIASDTYQAMPHKPEPTGMPPTTAFNAPTITTTTRYTRNN